MTNRFVLDTNVIVNALLLPAGVPRRAFDKALDTGAVLVSVPLLTELNEVLSRKKFDKYILAEERMRFLAALVREAQLIEATEKIAECRDPKDDKVLELAVASRAACVVSGDDDLLALNPFRDIPILQPADFLGFGTG